MEEENFVGASESLIGSPKTATTGRGPAPLCSATAKFRGPGSRSPTRASGCGSEIGVFLLFQGSRPSINE